MECPTHTANSGFQLLDHRRDCCGGRAGVTGVPVHQVLQLFAGLKEGNLFSRDFDAVSSFRIATNAGFSLTGAEAAETANLDLVASAQGTNDAVEDGFDDNFAVFAGY